jgi:hypothetical protein
MKKGWGGVGSIPSWQNTGGFDKTLDAWKEVESAWGFYVG